MKKAKKIIAGILAFACVGVVSVGVGTNGFRDIGTQNVEQQQGATNGGMVTEQLTAQGMTLRTVAAEPSAQAESSVTVTATLQTSGTTFNDDLAWTIGFKTNSTWASGKTVSDYVTMTVAQDTHSITLDCKQAFGEPITVTATSLENEKATATCQLDYVKRVTGHSTLYLNDSNDTLYLTKENTIHYTNNLGVGTIIPTFVVKDVQVYDSHEALSDERIVDIVGYPFNIDYSGVGRFQGGSADDGSGSIDFEISLGNFFGGVVLTAEQERRIYNLLLQESMLTEMWVSFDYEYTYKGKVYSDGTMPLVGIVSYDGITVQTVNSVTLNQSNVAF